MKKNKKKKKKKQHFIAMSDSRASTGQNAYEQRPKWTSQAWTNST